MLVTVQGCSILSNLPRCLCAGQCSTAFQSRVSPIFTACPSLSLERPSAEGTPGSAQSSKTCHLFVLALRALCTHFTRLEVRRWCLKKKPQARGERTSEWFVGHNPQPVKWGLDCWGAFWWWLWACLKSTYNFQMAQSGNCNKFWGTGLVCIHMVTAVT